MRSSHYKLFTIKDFPVIIWSGRFWFVHDYRRYSSRRDVGWSVLEHADHGEVVSEVGDELTHSALGWIRVGGVCREGLHAHLEVVRSSRSENLLRGRHGVEVVGVVDDVILVRFAVAVSGVVEQSVRGEEEIADDRWNHSVKCVEHVVGVRARTVPVVDVEVPGVDHGLARG